jgi:TolB-like protein/Flp pilus assembly protein TadD
VPDIFLSYNREDQATAKVFAEAFAIQGFDVWWDVGLKTGEAYDEVTETALRTAKAVVVLWSKNSVISRWVRAEATLADRNKTLVPCMIEPCERPIMFELTQTAELGHWQGDAQDRAWLAFLGDVRRFVAKDMATAAATPSPAVAAPTIQETLKPGQSGSAPSLAVLPFTNRSSLPEDEIFAEGMVEDVISALSQGVNVRVLGATATANLSRAAITDLAALGRQLGVKYLLEGNVRRVGANLRVTTQLLEAATGEVIWTAKFDRPLAELAELQEELVTEVAANLDTQVFQLEMERALKKPGDITAWEAVTRVTAALRRMDAAAIMGAIEEGKRAVAIAPDYGMAQASFAGALTVLYLFSMPDDPAEVQRIRAIAERGLVLAPDDSSVLAFAGNAIGLLGFPEEGVLYTERAVRKTPGHGVAHHFHGSICCMCNRYEEALAHFNTATRLMPGSHIMWLIKAWRAGALRALGRLEEASASIDEAIALYPAMGHTYISKATICVQLGRDAEARSLVATGRRLGTDLASSERITRRLNPNSPDLETHIAILRDLFAQTEPGA